MELSPEELTKILERFGHFHDAVIRRVPVDAEGSNATIEIDASEATSERAWRRLRFDISGLIEWRFERIRSATEVVFEANARWFGDLMFLSLDGPRGDMTDVDDFRSAGYFAGRACRLAEYELSA